MHDITGRNPKLTTGDIYTVAGNGVSAFAGDGGPAIDAEISYSRDLAVDSYGNIIVFDWGDDRVRLVAANTCTSSCSYGLPSMTEGYIYTIAGGGSCTIISDPFPSCASPSLSQFNNVSATY